MTIRLPLLIAILQLSAITFAQDATALKEQARAIFKQGNYQAAIAAYKQAEAAAARTYGPNDQRTDIVANELAMSYYKQGEYAAAIPLFERVYRNTRDLRRGTENYHYDLATSLNNLAGSYDELGDDVKAEELYRTALETVLGRHGKDDPYVATEFNNLAGIYRDRGDYIRAIDAYRRSLELYRRQPQPEAAKVASALHNLAVTTSYLGQDAEAEKFYREALRLRLANLGPEHPAVASSLLGLAGLLEAKGDMVEAQKLFERALSIRRKKLGDDHPDVATALSNFAEFLRKQNQFAESERLHREALAIRERKLGADSVFVAHSLHNLAGLLRELNRDDDALGLYARSLKICRDKYGGENPELAKTLFGSAVLLAKLGQWNEAAAAFDESRRIIRKYNAQILPALKPAEQLTFLKSTDERFLEASLAAAYANRENQTFVDLSAAWLLNAKGVAQQALAERETLDRAKADAGTAETAKDLERVRSELSRLNSGAGKNAENANVRAELEKLRGRQRQLVEQLATQGGRSPQAGEWAELNSVRKTLPPNGVLLQIVRFRPRDFKRPVSDPQMWLPPRYAAWIIPATDAGPVKFIDLGPADAIEGAVNAARSDLEKSISAIQAEGEADAEKQLRGKLRSVSDLVLAPCLKALPKVDTIYLSPDASLWLIPWAALPIDDQSYAVEKFTLSYLVSGRDLLVAPGDAAAKLAPPQVFADPDYDLTAANAAAAARALWRSTPPPSAQKWPCEVTLGKVQRLAATAQEATLVAPRLKQFAGAEPYVYLQQNALELVVKNVKRPQSLVISTHGFFLPEEARDAADGESFATQRGKAASNPLLRCGLLLGGCNNPPTPGADDGILNGMEIVRLDLRGTELVVLSACQTALGQVQNGEGVAGLRQAFQLAGAKSVLATLWEVPDNDTAKLMIEFFGQLAEGKNKADALRAAQLKRITARRDRYGAAHPFYWGAFTLTGGN